jgi:tryptophanyl-tRNA synthetase
MDLTVPQYGIPLYDWVISLEVAEHIPSKYESIYLDNLFRHANEGIILSWAVPGQNGMSHINTRPLSYVIQVMSENGFERDETSSTRFKKAACSFLHKTAHRQMRHMTSPLLILIFHVHIFLGHLQN